MKIADLEFDENTLAHQKSNSFFTMNAETLKEDFNRLYTQYLNIVIPEATEQNPTALQNVKVHKTDLFVAFVMGHVNFLDLDSSLTKSMHKVGGKESELILPEEKKLILPEHLAK